MAELIRQAELARRIGVSRAAVSAAAKAGRITPVSDGLFDSAIAISEWRDNTRQNSEKTPGDRVATRAPGGQPKYASSRARKELALAQMAELRLAQKSGDLFPLDDVETTLLFFGGEMRAAMENFPDRVTPLISTLSSPEEMYEILKDECRNVLLEIGQAAERKLDALKRGDHSGSGSEAIRTRPVRFTRKVGQGETQTGA
jgi:hypothetical protein